MVSVARFGEGSEPLIEFEADYFDLQRDYTNSTLVLHSRTNGVTRDALAITFPRSTDVFVEMENARGVMRVYRYDREGKHL